MKLKVDKGTRTDGGSSLCESCRSATVVRGGAVKEEIIYCGYLGERVLFNVRTCSMYDDRSKPTLRAMQAVAWELATDKGGRKIGFMSPKDIRDRRKDKDLELGPPAPLVLPDGTTEYE